MLKNEQIVIKAEEIARRAHQGQIKKFGVDKGKPYIIHPQRIANKFKHNYVLQSIAWLHDVIEYTNVTLVELKNEGMLPEILYGVDIITQKPKELYVDYILRLQNCPFALPVKIQEVLDNLSSIPKEKGFKTLRDKYHLTLALLGVYKSDMFL